VGSWRRWKEAGLDCLEVVQGSVDGTLKQIADSAVRVDVHFVLRPSEDEALRAADIGASGVNEVVSNSCPPCNHATS
jgi:hypothetical protein